MFEGKYVSRSSHGRSRIKCSKDFFKSTFLVIEKISFELDGVEMGGGPFFKVSWKGWRSRGGGLEEQSQEHTLIKYYTFEQKVN